LREDGTPYYIGKGTGRRAWTHAKREVRPFHDKSNIIILEHNLTEVAALALERQMIKWYGRKDLGTGILRNKSEGGDGSVGAVRSAETRAKIAKAMLGVHKGRKLGPASAETRLKMSKTRLGKTTGPKSADSIAKRTATRKLNREKLLAEKDSKISVNILAIG
jgi:hypothetical protein